ncbi:MAG: pyruvate kinase, partial [Nitrospirae bacterium]|nr:pyruvate kinase [Nitrospirota bacterium]
YIANQVKASIIVAISQTGKTAQRLSAARPHVPIVALTEDKKVSRQLIMYWGVIPLLLNDLAGIDQKPGFIFELIQKKGLTLPGEAIILTGELPSGKPGSNSFIRVFQNETPDG